MEISNATANVDFELIDGQIIITDCNNDLQYTLDASDDDIQIHANNGEQMTTVEDGWDYLNQCPTESRRHYSEIEIEPSDVKAYALANRSKWSAPVSIAE